MGTTSKNYLTGSYMASNSGNNDVFNQFYATRQSNKEIANTKISTGYTTPSYAPAASGVGTGGQEWATPPASTPAVITTKVNNEKLATPAPIPGNGNEKPTSVSNTTTLPVTRSYAPPKPATPAPVPEPVTPEPMPTVPFYPLRQTGGRYAYTEGTIGDSMKNSAESPTTPTAESIYNSALAGSNNLFYSQNIADFGDDPIVTMQGQVNSLTSAINSLTAMGAPQEYINKLTSEVTKWQDAIKSYTRVTAHQEDVEEENEKEVSEINWDRLYADFVDAKNYADWLEQHGYDSEEDRAEAYKNRMAEFDRNRSTYGQNAENLAQLGLTNSGYSDYLDGVGYAAYIAGLSEADSQKAMQDAEYARQYAQYLSEKEAEAKQQTMALYGSVMSGELTPEQAMQYAKFLGASDEDAQAIYDMANTVASTVTPSNTNAELNTMSTNVLSVMMENGYGVDTAIKMLYPDATADQITHIKQYVSDVEGAYKYDQNQALLDGLNTTLNTISQNLTYGNGASDIGSYEDAFNSIINSGANEDTISEAKEKISASVLVHLKALYDYDNKTATEEKYLASYIAAAYGNEEDKSGMTAYSALDDTDKDDFLRTTIDELFNAGVLTEKDYNDIKGVAFGIDLENAKNIKDNAELMEKADAGWYGTESNIASIKNTIADIIAPIEIMKKSKSGTIIGHGIESQPAQFNFSIKTKDSKLAYDLNLENYNYWIGDNSYKEISSEKIPAEEGFFAYDDNIFYIANYMIQTGENSYEQMPLIFVLNQSKNTSITYQDGKKIKTLTPEQLKSIIPMLKDYLLEFTIK